MKSSNDTLLSWPFGATKAGAIARIAIGVLLLTLSAKVQVPFWPVPMTLQVAAVMALAAAYGLRLGSATFLTYLAVGAMGLPVFAGTPEKGIGLAYMMGPTGGYLVGFALATALVGHCAQRFGKWLLWPAMLAGLAVIYASGLGWLSMFVPGDKLLAAGFLPFILGDLVKISLAAGIVLGAPQMWQAWLNRGADQRGGGSDA